MARRRNYKNNTTVEKPVIEQPPKVEINDPTTSQRNFFHIPDRFAVINKLIARDLNDTSAATPKFTKYTKDDITSFLENPYTNQKQIRDAITYIYGASEHFARLIQYFSSLTNLSYVVVPYKLNGKVNDSALLKKYRKVVNAVDSFQIKSQLSNIVNTCFKYDVFYGYIWDLGDALTIQQLPIDYCGISSVEGGVFNISFNLQYFDSNRTVLPFYPEEIQKLYDEYKNGKGSRQKWVELSSPNAFAVKFNKDIAAYSLPPFAGLLREVYDLEDYCSLKLTKTELENYALLIMKLLMDKDGNWLMDEKKALHIFNNLSAVLPEEVGAVLSPMEITKIDFDKTSADTADTIAEAEQNLYTAAGVSSLIFNNEKASANALLVSIKADQALTFSIVKSIEDVLNRYIQAQSYGSNFKLDFIDVSRYNEKEKSDEYLKGMQYGLPFISHYAASVGLSQSDVENLNILEVDLLKLPEKFVTLTNSAQKSADDQESTGGRPRKDDEELTDSGEQSREDGVGDGDW